VALVDYDLQVRAMERESLTGHMSVMASSLDFIELVGLKKCVIAAPMSRLLQCKTGND
jgi:hypothetical protein